MSNIEQRYSVVSSNLAKNLDSTVETMKMRITLMISAKYDEIVQSIRAQPKAESNSVIVKEVKDSAWKNMSTIQEHLRKLESQMENKIDNLSIPPAPLRYPYHTIQKIEHRMMNLLQIYC